LMPATMAILHDAFPKEEQGRVLGIWGAVGGVAFAVGPLIGGFFTDALSWRWVWWSNVPVAIVALVLAGPMLRGRSSGKRGVRFDVAGIVLLAVGLFSAILALQQGSRWGWTSPLLLAMVAVAAITLTAFVLVELRVQAPLVHLRLLRDAVFTAGNIGTFVNAIALIGILYFFRYVGASLVVAVGSLVFSSAGIAELNRQLGASGVNRPEEEQLDQALTGSPSAIAGSANGLQGNQRQAFISGAQHGTVEGFDASMMVIAVSSIGGLVLWLVLVRPSGRAVSRPSPSSPPSEPA